MPKIAIKGSDITKENVNKVLSFSDDEIAVTSTDEKQGLIATLAKRSDDIKFQINSLKESSGINELDSEDKRIQLFLEKLRLSLNDLNQMPDNSIAIVNIHDEDTVTTTDGDDTHTEVQDNVVARYLVEKKTFLVLNDDIDYHNYLLKLVELDLKLYLKLGKTRLAIVSDDNLINLINELQTLGLIDAVTILPSLYTSLLELPLQKQVLIDANFIHVVSDISIGKAKSRQMNLLQEEEEISLDVIPLDVEDVSDANQ
jgi:hypothetical protein